ncbi:MAG: hypothetical protein Q9211_000410 [Gyalolechia sp. 1 TL-2023]
MAPLPDGAVLVEAAPVALESALPVGELERDVCVELPVLLPVLVDETVLVDMLVMVEAPVFVEDPALEVGLVNAAAVLDDAALLVAVAALVMAAELAGEDNDSTVFLDSTTNGAE